MGGTEGVPCFKYRKCGNWWTMNSCTDQTMRWPSKGQSRKGAWILKVSKIIFILYIINLNDVDVNKLKVLLLIVIFLSTIEFHD